MIQYTYASIVVSDQLPDDKLIEQESTWAHSFESFGTEQSSSGQRQRGSEGETESSQKRQTLEDIPCNLLPYISPGTIWHTF